MHILTDNSCQTIFHKYKVWQEFALVQSKLNCWLQSYAVQVRRFMTFFFLIFLYQVGKPGQSRRWYLLVLAGVTCTACKAPKCEDTQQQ